MTQSNAEVQIVDLDLAIQSSFSSSCSFVFKDRDPKFGGVLVLASDTTVYSAIEKVVWLQDNKIFVNYAYLNNFENKVIQIGITVKINGAYDMLSSFMYTPLTITINNDCAINQVSH